MPGATEGEGGGVHEDEDAEGEEVGEVGGEVGGGFDFVAERGAAAPDFGEDFFADLDGAFGPAMLLGFEAVHVWREFGRDDDVFEVNEAPAFELGAVGEVEVFGEGVVLPAAGFGDGLAAPDAGGAVEVEVVAVAAAGGLFEDEVAVEEEGLEFGEEGEIPVEVTPAGLDHADGGVGEVVDEFVEVVGSGEEVGVEDADEFAGGLGHGGVEGAGFEAGAVGAVVVGDVVALGAEFGAEAGAVGGGFVGGVVKDLDLEAVARVIEGGDGVEEAVDHECLIEEGELDGDFGEVFEAGGLFGFVLAMMPVVPEDFDPVRSKSRQARENEGVADHPN